MTGLFDLAGKTAIVTGSTRGIGRAIAEALITQGARVLISSESLLIANLSIRRGGHTPLIHDRVVADACRSMSRQLLVTDRAVCRVHGLLRGRDMHAAGWVFVGGIFRCV